MEYMGYAFADVIAGKRVNLYRDAFGRYWLATGRFSIFRVPTTERFILQKDVDSYLSTKENQCAN